VCRTGMFSGECHLVKIRHEAVNDIVADAKAALELGAVEQAVAIRIEFVEFRLREKAHDVLCRRSTTQRGQT